MCLLVCRMDFHRFLSSSLSVKRLTEGMLVAQSETLCWPKLCAPCKQIWRGHEHLSNEFRPLPSSATSLMGVWWTFDINPSTLNTANPAKKLVKQFTPDVMMASLESKIKSNIFVSSHTWKSLRPNCKWSWIFLWRWPILSVARTAPAKV